MGVRNTWMEVEWDVDERPGKGDGNGREMIKGERLMERNSAAEVDELGKGSLPDCGCKRSFETWQEMERAAQHADLTIVQVEVKQIVEASPIDTYSDRVGDTRGNEETCRALC
jgi:hypothetical protein